jgi:thioredoxin-like negative regulator of GroEL
VAAADRGEGVEAAYLAAEAAMRGGGRDHARRALDAVVARDPDGARGEAALLDLARLELAAGDAAAARRHLARLPDPARDPGLAEGAHHLRCRVAVKLGGGAEATTCLLAFRRRYPRSPHDAESLAWLAGVTRRLGRCWRNTSASIRTVRSPATPGRAWRHAPVICDSSAVRRLS